MIHIPPWGTLAHDWQNRNNWDYIEKSCWDYVAIWMWNASHWFLYLDPGFPKVALFGKAMETWWRSSLKEVGNRKSHPTSCLLSTSWLKMQCGNLLHIPTTKPPCHSGLCPLRLWPTITSLSSFWSQHKEETHTGCGRVGGRGREPHFTSPNPQTLSHQTLYGPEDERGFAS